MRKTTLLVTTTFALAVALPHVPTAEAASEHVIYAFKGSPDGPDGAVPIAGLLYLKRMLWGTTQQGGSKGLGTVFKVTTTGAAENVVHPFSGLDGNDPYAGLIAGVYGTTEIGGVNDRGTVFKVSPKTGAEKVLYSFGNTSTDGSFPVAGLINVGGTLYGTTYAGGDNTSCPSGCGTVFSLEPRTRNPEKVIHSFQGGTADGWGPSGGLVYVNGILYGTTSFGGAQENTDSPNGTLFSIDPATGTEQVLYSFCTVAFENGCGDGGDPDAGLIEVNGILYGTTSRGGSADCNGVNCDGGSVFSFDPATGTEQVLYSFCTQYADNNCSDGNDPEAGLLAVNANNTTTLYGTTVYGGSAGLGTVFSLNLTSGMLQTLSFQGGTDGAYPYAGLIAVISRSGATNLYGTTAEGGGSSNCSSGCGTVFAVNP